MHISIVSINLFVLGSKCALCTLYIEFNFSHWFSMKIFGSDVLYIVGWFDKDMKGLWSEMSEKDRKILTGN